MGSAWVETMCEEYVKDFLVYPPEKNCRLAKICVFIKSS